MEKTLISTSKSSQISKFLLLKSPNSDFYKTKLIFLTSHLVDVLKNIDCEPDLLGLDVQHFHPPIGEYLVGQTFKNTFNVVCLKSKKKLFVVIVKISEMNPWSLFWRKVCVVLILVVYSWTREMNENSDSVPLKPRPTGIRSSLNRSQSYENGGQRPPIPPKLRQQSAAHWAESQRARSTSCRQSKRARNTPSWVNRKRPASRWITER